jgi:hypothetical protein
MLLDIRPTTSVEQVLRGARSLPVGRGHAVRWIIDLNVVGLREPPPGHPALMRIDP